MHINTVDLEDVADAGLAYLMQVEQLELLDALIEIVAQGDAVAPALDFPTLGPEHGANWVAGLEHPAKGAYVDGLFFRGNMADSSCKRLRPRRRRFRSVGDLLAHLRNGRLKPHARCTIINGGI